MITSLEITFQPYNPDRSDLKYSVIVARYQNQYLLCRHRDRTTWEVPGGHIEDGETPFQTAQRELYEESGALRYELHPVRVYGVGRNGVFTYGALYHAEILELGELPPSEIAEVALFDEMPSNMTYAQIQPFLMEEVDTWCARQ